MPKIGLVRGAGTGSRLADIFTSYLSLLAKANKSSYKVYEDLDSSGEPYIYHSYHSIVRATQNDIATFKEVSDEEADRLKNLAQKWFREGVEVSFRTSVNAESLYRYRQEVQAVKEISFFTEQGVKVMIVRDQAEGFYANRRYIYNSDDIEFSGTYSREYQTRFAKWALDHAKKNLQAQHKKWAIYKNHLFGNILEEWFKGTDASLKTFQPGQWNYGIIKLYS